MTEGMAIEIAQQKMRELKVGDKYLFRYRHLFLRNGQTLQIRAAKDVFILLSATKFIEVKSQTGIFNLEDQAISEMQYVHTGLIILTNLDPEMPQDIKFLQVIPLINNT